MPEILLGLAALVGILVLLRLFVSANPSTLVRAIRYAGVVLLALAAGWLFYIREIGYGFLVGGMAWGLYTNGHIWPSFHFGPFGMFNYGGGARRSRGRSRSSSASGQTTRVTTAWVELELDHDSGTMEGRVVQGAFAGRALASMSKDEVLGFYQAASGDSETARLLEAYMDRRFGPEWRDAQQQEQPKSEDKPRGRRDSGMSREEAFSVLGLKPGASEDDIRAAHKKLMMQMHPDRGGSDYLAAKINEAKDVLLQQHL